MTAHGVLRRMSRAEAAAIRNGEAATPEGLEHVRVCREWSVRCCCRLCRCRLWLNPNIPPFGAAVIVSAEEAGPPC